MHALIMPTTCGENSRAAFRALSVRTTQREFEGGDNSRCGEISRKYGIYVTVQGMSSLCSLIPFRLSHLLVMHLLYCALQIYLALYANLFNWKFYAVDTLRRGRLDHQCYVHALLSALSLGARAHPCDYVNQLAKETR